jgi:purine nucleoside phosphorylase
MTKGLEQLRDYHAETAIILGSGLNSRVVDPAKDQIIPYAEFSEIPQPSVPGHLGRFRLGEIEKTKIIFAQGRVHLYEGHSARKVTSRLFACSPKLIIPAGEPAVRGLWRWRCWVE